MPVTTTKQKKNSKLRYLEYYDLQDTLDMLYADSGRRKIFNNLMPLIESEENIRLAYRNIKRNSGSNTSGVDKLTIKDIEKIPEPRFVEIVRKKLQWYEPKSELKLFAGQAVNALKSEIATLVTDKIVNADVKAFAANKDFLNAFIVALASKWSVDEPIVISTSDAEGLKKYFTAQAKELLDKGVKIEQVNGNKTLFSVSPADGSYKVNFGEEEFMNYFKEFLRPQLVEMLF